MDMVALRRKHTGWAIQQNPTTITINRTEKTDMGGYFEEVKTEVGPFVVRLYGYGTWLPQEVSTLAGTKQVDKTWGMLADCQADIKAGPNVLDRFEVSGMGCFRVLEVYPQVVKGELVGYQVALEKVS
jgi:hypothetical protein